jgi:hypothetical protein
MDMRQVCTKRSDVGGRLRLLRFYAFTRMEVIAEPAAFGVWFISETSCFGSKR